MNEQDIERVLQAAGPREHPSAEFERAMQDRLREEWRAIVAGERRRRQRRTTLALAAGVVAAAFGTWLVAPQLGGPAQHAATVALAAGDMRAKPRQLARWRAVAPGQTLATGTVLETGATGRGALALADAVSARLDHDTRLVFTAAGEITLERGALYVDAGRGAESPGRLAVITPAGSIRHVGTQYEARLLGSSLRLRVREGRVEWQSPEGRREQGASGEQLTIGNDGAVERASAPAHGESWDWIARTSPGIVIDGLPLEEFLAWVARELGWKVVYATPAVAAEAADVVLHGSIEGLTPRQALDAVLATTRVRAAIQGGSMIVSGQEAPTPPPD